ncbi:unnamed protein product [Trichobilharzia regenti]|nr:unnamed protein product [Trichobilharzia regenti]
MAINSSQYTHTTAPILEAWLIKALRLVHSKKPSDRDKLRKLYREACENEAQVAHMTIAEALREHREAVSVSSSMNELNVPTPSSGSTTTTTTTASTVATACVIDSTNSTPTPTTPINATTHHPNCDQVLNSVNNPPSPSPTSSVILNTPITTTGTNAATGSIPSSIQSTNRTAVKRNKVAFFNIFDIASSTASNNNNNNNSSTSTSTTSKNITIQRCLSQLDNLINNTESAGMFLSYCISIRFVNLLSFVKPLISE